jgi:adenylylsulfate kinase-like enzyme
VNDPYEAPEAPELRLDTTHQMPEQSADEVWLYLEREGYLA